MLLYWAVLINLLNYLIYCINATKTSCSESNFNGKKLENHIYQKLEGMVSFEKCKKECYLHRSCQSFNYQTTTYHCELNNANDTGNSGDLIQDQTWTYTTFNPNETVHFSYSYLIIALIGHFQWSFQSLIQSYRSISLTSLII